MHEKLKEYFEKEKELREKKEKELREAILIKEGIYEKVYSENNERTEEYNQFEYNSSGTGKYFKYQPIEITDEEYMQIKEIYDNKHKLEPPSSNGVANALTVIAWIIFVVGFIAGICFANVEVGTYVTYEEFSFAIALIYWLVAFASGTMFLGFAEIIKLLNDIKNK